MWLLSLTICYIYHGFINVTVSYTIFQFIFYAILTINNNLQYRWQSPYLLTIVCLLCYIPVFQYYTNMLMISLYCIITLDIVDIKCLQILQKYIGSIIIEPCSIDHKINSYWKITSYNNRINSHMMLESCDERESTMRSRSWEAQVSEGKSTMRSRYCLFTLLHTSISILY
jgi:hypothetical protein